MEAEHNKKVRRTGNHTASNPHPAAVQDRRPGFGNKKLEGPNRPST